MYLACALAEATSSERLAHDDRCGARSVLAAVVAGAFARFDEAEALFHRAIDADRYASDAWTGLARSSFLKQNLPAAAEFARQNYQLSLIYNKDHLGDAAEAEVHWARYRAEAGDAGPAVQQILGALPDLRKDYYSDPREDAVVFRLSLLNTV